METSVRCLSWLIPYITLTLPALICDASVDKYSVEVSEEVLRDISHKGDLLGLNLALWTPTNLVQDDKLITWIKALEPETVRIPGGSWSNEYYWNGNGVRKSSGQGTENFDLDKRKADGTWAIDYSDYAPGFRVHGDARDLSNYHGAMDVLGQHQWISEIGSKSFITVNVGSGNSQMAKEWVSWANTKNNFKVYRCEIGNELNGDWEMGHRLKNGERMDGTHYAQIFKDYAASVRESDPNVQLGGPASSDLKLDFCEELIRNCGDTIDFISFHTYPVPVKKTTVKEKFDAIEEIRPAVHKIRSWFEQYHPNRKDVVEIGISEWNMKVQEDQDTVGLVNGLWSTACIGTMLDTGIDFANQWDISTQTKTGGHSTFSHLGGEAPQPKSIYWAMWIWKTLMGDQLLKVKTNTEKNGAQGNQHLHSFATTQGKDLQLLFINTHQENSSEIRLKLPDLFDFDKVGSKHIFSKSEYFWNPYTNHPLWSMPPKSEPLEYSKSMRIEVPPFSICVVSLKEKTLIENHAIDLNNDPKIIGNNDYKLEIILPSKAADNKDIDGWICAYREIDGRRTPIQKELSVKLKIGKSTQLLKFSGGIKPVIIKARSAGIVEIEALSGNVKASHELLIIKQDVYQQTGWTFEEPPGQWNASSTFKIGQLTSQKPNKYVAACHLEGVTPEQNKDILFHFEPIDERISKDSIIGLTGEISISKDMKCSDPNARIQLVIQSNSNHWIPLGNFRLKDLVGKWKRFDFKAKQAEIEEQLEGAYAVRIRIESKRPLKGDVYLNNLGFIYKKKFN